jgi:flagellar M-ring protein FliF
VIRPMLKPQAPGRALLALASAGASSPGVTQLQMAGGVGPAGSLEGGAQGYLPGPDEFEQRIDIAKIEGQVKASSVKKVAEFVDKHPEESVSIIRSWLHES